MSLLVRNLKVSFSYDESQFILVDDDIYKLILLMLYKTILIETALFHGCKNEKIVLFFLFLLKHRFWVLVRTASVQNRLTEAVLTSTHTLCFEAKIRKQCIPL